MKNNCNIYEGHFQKGKAHGVGCFYCDEGHGNFSIIKYGVWEEGKQIKWFT